MNMILRAFALVSLVVLSACTTVTTTNPIGIAKGKVEDSRVMGSWKFVAKDDKDQKETANAYFLAKEGGGISGLLVIPQENEWWEAEVVVGKAGDNTMFNVHPLRKNGEEPKTSDKVDGYFPLRYTVGTDGAISLFMWDGDKLKDALMNKAVAGTETNSEITLTAEPAALDAYFSGAGADIFSQPYATLFPVK